MKRHSVDPISLVAGLVFGFLALFFLFGNHTTNDLAWPWAAVIPLMAVGVAAVLVGLRRALAYERSHAPPPKHDVPEAETESEP